VTLHVRQGKYATAAVPGAWPAPDLQGETIAGVRQLAARDFRLARSRGGNHVVPPSTPSTRYRRR
jgi:hypothetical protein